MLAVAQVLFAVGPWMVALPVAITNADIKGVQDYSLVLSAFAGGAIVGALLGGKIKVGKPGLVALPCLALFGVAALTTGLEAHAFVQIVAYGLAGAGTQVFDVLKLRGIRRTIPENEHGRAYSADFFFSFAALRLGQLIGAAVLGFASPETVLVFGGIFVLATGLLPLLSREVRNFGTQDEQAGTAPADNLPAIARGQRPHFTSANTRPSKTGSAATSQTCARARPRSAWQPPCTNPSEPRSPAPSTPPHNPSRSPP